MKLLIEHVTDQLEFLTEDTKTGKKLYLEGPMLQAEDKNRNGRVYPKSVMEKSVDQYITEYVNERRALGELDHPPRPNVDTGLSAWIVESLTWKGNLVNGKAQVLDTPRGQIVKALMEANFKLGASSRGLGSVTERAGTTFVNKYLITAIDSVDKPSAQVAYMNAINESMDNEWINESGIWVEKKILNTKKLMNNIDKLIEIKKKG